MGNIPLFFVAFLSYIRFRVSHKAKDSLVVSFFHPHAAGRGGGERVLWAAVDGLLDREDIKSIVIFSLDTDRVKILRDRHETFNLKSKPSDSKIIFKKLYFSTLLEPRSYPIATIFGQSLGSIIVLLSGLLTISLAHWPDVFIDSTGCPFTLPCAKIVTGAQTQAYVHYPTMSNDMLIKVASRRADFNNKAVFTSNPLLLKLKTMYYRFFLLCYRCCGWFVDVAVGNSNWTVSRVRKVWCRQDISVLYPPAAIGDFQSLSSIPKSDDNQREDAIVSLSQFRPEKNHILQLRVFAQVLKKQPKAVLWLMGGVRNKEDETLVEELRYQAFDDLKIPKDRIEFIMNVPREEVNSRLARAKCAIHTMVDEHFGISLLEYLHAKIPIVSHRSGGPEMDILLPDEKFGYLAISEEEFADKIVNVISNFDSAEVKQKRIDGFNSLSRFQSDEAFGRSFASIFVRK
jgi:alpha-1,2-mannosyltransferase